MFNPHKFVYWVWSLPFSLFMYLKEKQYKIAMLLLCPGQGPWASSLCIYLGEGKGGGALMHVYVLEHIISLSYRTTWWMFTKLDRDEVLLITHLFIGFSANSTKGRIKGGGGQFAKNRSMRGSFSKGLLLQIGMQQQQTECIPVSWIEILRLLLFWLISQIWQSCFLIC